MASSKISCRVHVGVKTGRACPPSPLLYRPPRPPSPDCIPAKYPPSCSKSTDPDLVRTMVLIFCIKLFVRLTPPAPVSGSAFDSPRGEVDSSAIAGDLAPRPPSRRPGERAGGEIPRSIVSATTQSQYPSPSDTRCKLLTVQGVAIARRLAIVLEWFG
jgi:hypothetical protein